MLALLNWRVWAAVSVAFFLAGTHWKAYKMGEATIRAEVAIRDLRIANDTIKLQQANVAKEASLVASMETLTEDKNEQITKLNGALNVALDSLQHRPTRPSGSDLSKTPGAQSGPGCTGAQLYRDDASLLIREANRADRLLADLKQCQDFYSAASKTVGH